MARSRKYRRKTKRRGGGILKYGSNNTGKPKKTLSFNSKSKEYSIDPTPTQVTNNIPNITPNITIVNTKSETNIIEDGAKYWNNKIWSSCLVKFIQKHPNNTITEFSDYEDKLYKFLNSKFSKRLIKKNSAAEKLYRRMKILKEAIFINNIPKNNNTEL